MADGDIQALDVRDEVNAALLAVEPRMAAKGLDSVSDIPPDVRLAAEPAKLRGILLTLLTNAIRFSNRGGFVMIDVGYPEDMPGDVVMVRVGDSGRGIGQDRQEEIFAQPVGADRSAPSREPGTGPGLPTCRAWAREMGGDLRVRSDVDRGSVFTLKLPRASMAS